MGEIKVRYQKRDGDKGREISPPESGAATSAAAGAANLLAWQKQEAAKSGAEGLAAEEFRRALVAEIGPNPTAAQLGLVSAACAMFEALELARKRIRRRRKRNPVNLAEIVSQLAGNLRRVLGELGLGSADPLLPEAIADTPGEQPEPTLQELIRGEAENWEPPTWAKPLTAEELAEPVELAIKEEPNKA